MKNMRNEVWDELAQREEKTKTKNINIKWIEKCDDEWKLGKHSSVTNFSFLFFRVRRLPSSSSADSMLFSFGDIRMKTITKTPNENNNKKNEEIFASFFYCDFNAAFFCPRWSSIRFHFNSLAVLFSFFLSSFLFLSLFISLSSVEFRYSVRIFKNFILPIDFRYIQIIDKYG